MRREERWDVAHLGLRFRRWAVGPSGFACHVGLYLVGAAAAILINLATAPSDLWFWRPLLVWGGVVALHAALLLSTLVRGAATTDPTAAAPDRSAVLLARPASRPARLRPVAARLASGTRRLAARGGRAFAQSVQSFVAAAAGREDGTRPERPTGWPLARQGAAGVSSDEIETWPEARPQPTPSPDPTSTWTIAAASDHGHQPASARPAPVPPVSATAPGGRPGATGRFAGWAGSRELPAPAPAPPAASPHNGRAPNGAAPTERLPAAVEALWPSSVPGVPSRPAPPNAATANPRPRRVEPPHPAPSAHSALPPAPRPATGRGRAEEQGEDIVLRGPFPVDARDPRWTRLEAEAAAWLAHREADGTRTAPPTTPDDGSPPAVGR